MSASQVPASQTNAWLDARARGRTSSEPVLPAVAAASPGVAATASGNELVIDLPEGQKVILGRLPAGAVVEIASWRGTGPPDSRTSRLLLGTADAAALRAGANANASAAASAGRGTGRRSASASSSGSTSTGARVALVAICVVAVAALGLVVYTAIFT